VDPVALVAGANDSRCCVVSDVRVWRGVDAAASERDDATAALLLFATPDSERYCDEFELSLPQLHAAMEQVTRQPPVRVRHVRRDKPCCAVVFRVRQLRVSGVPVRAVDNSSVDEYRPGNNRWTAERVTTMVVRLMSTLQSHTMLEVIRAVPADASRVCGWSDTHHGQL
jgi:hypothetical protein